jgi:hypothetical protein
LIPYIPKELPKNPNQFLKRRNSVPPSTLPTNLKT